MSDKMRKALEWLAGEMRDELTDDGASLPQWLVKSWLKRCDEALAEQPAQGEAVDKGPWRAVAEHDNPVTGVWIESDDFAHDVRLYVNGDFADQGQRLAYAKRIADCLNAPPAPSEQPAQGDHWSDCATGDGPAYPVGPCDCMPTPAMCRAAVEYMNGADVYQRIPAEPLAIEESIYAEVWKAMQAKAPPAPSATDDEAGYLLNLCRARPGMGNKEIIAEMREVFAAPPVPDEKPRPHRYVVTCLENWGDGYADGWNACRAAMLASGGKASVQWETCESQCTCKVCGTVWTAPEAQR